MITVQEVYNACKNGDINFLKNFLDSDLFKYSNQVSVHQMLLHGCFDNQLEIVKCIFDMWEARRTFKVLDEVRELVKITCEKGYFEITKFLLEQPELKDENANSDAPMMAALYCSSFGHLNILKYIFESFPDDPLMLKGLKNGIILDAACDEGRLEIVKYLMESPDIKIKFGLQDNGNQLFRAAYDRNHFEVLRYFIFDLNLEKTEDIKEYMSHVFKKDVDNMFNVRELNKSLKEELSTQSDNTSISKKPKV
jgi:ankyrin repeat protein